MKVEIDDSIIKALKEAYERCGYDLPETEEGWTPIIEAMLNEKITEDFGE